MWDCFIKDFWDKNAEFHKLSHIASWGDTFCIELERKTISKYIKENASVLDVGCSNGHSTIALYKENLTTKIIGIDYSEKMIKYAIENKKKYFPDEKKIMFKSGDIRDLEFEDESFDIVYTTRVLINLPNWEEQIKGIDECIRVAKKGGLIIFCEAFWEPLALLNAIRKLLGLNMLVEHDFNRYLKQDKLEKLLINKNLEFKNEDFSSIYYLGTRVLREVIDNVKDSDSYENDFNRMFLNIEEKYSGGGMGIQQAYIITK